MGSKSVTVADIEAAIVSKQGPEDIIWNRGLRDGKYFHNAPGNHASSVEIEMGQKLKELVIETQPNVAIEIGTNKGHGATWIALGLMANAKGHLTTFDNSSEFPADKLSEGAVGYGRFFWQEFGVPEEWVTFVNKTTWDNPPELPLAIDFVFHDASHKKDETLKEIELLAPRVRASGIFCFHDVLLIEEMGFPVRDWFLARPTEWSYDVWPYGRGLGIARRL